MPVKMAAGSQPFGGQMPCTGHSNVYGATLFPHNIGSGSDPRSGIDPTASVWQQPKEVAATGIEWSFAPTVAVVRDDRWGRTYESYAEDPALVKAYAGQMVSGLQGTLGSQTFSRALPGLPPPNILWAMAALNKALTGAIP